MCEINLEAELFTLQDSNAKLVAALQEANSSVAQWKKQLAEYQEETDRLRDQVTYRGRTNKHLIIQYPCSLQQCSVIHNVKAWTVSNKCCSVNILHLFGMPHVSFLNVCNGATEVTRSHMTNNAHQASGSVRGYSSILSDLPLSFGCLTEEKFKPCFSSVSQYKTFFKSVQPNLFTLYLNSI